MDEQARATWAGALIGLAAGLGGALAGSASEPTGDETVRVLLAGVAFVAIVVFALLAIGVGPFRRPRPILALDVGDSEPFLRSATNSDFETEALASLPFTVANPGTSPEYGDLHPEHGWLVWNRLVRVDNKGNAPALGTRIVVANVTPTPNVLGVEPRPELSWLVPSQANITPKGSGYAVLIQWYRRPGSGGPAPAYLMAPAKFWMTTIPPTRLDLEVWCDGLKEPLRETIEIEDVMRFRPEVTKQ